MRSCFAVSADCESATFRLPSTAHRLICIAVSDARVLDIVADWNVSDFCPI